MLVYGIVGSQTMKQAALSQQDPELLPLSILGRSQPTACSLACSSTGVLAYPAETSVVLCKAGIQRRFLRARASPRPLACVTFSATGQHVAAGGDGDQASICIWETEGSLDPIVAFRGHKYGIASLAFSPDGKYLASAGAAYDGQLCIWDWKAGALIAKEQTQAHLRGLAWADAGSTVVSVGRLHLKAWVLSKATGIAARTRPSSASGFALKPRAMALRSQKDATFVAAAAPAPHREEQPDAEVGVLALAAGGKLGLLPAGGKDFERIKDLKVREAFDLAVSHSLIACASAGGSVHLLTPSLAPKVVLPHPGLSGESKLASAGTAEGADAITCEFDATGESLWVAYSDRSLVEWDVSNPMQASVKRTEHSHAGGITGLCLLHCCSEVPPGQVCPKEQVTAVTCSSDGTVGIWEIPMQTEACQQGANVSILRPAHSRPVPQPPSHRHSMEDMPLPLPGGAARGRSPPLPVTLTCVTASPDGSHIATGDVQGHVRVFSLHSKECLVDRVAHRGAVCSLDFSPTEAYGGLFLASGGKDSIVQSFGAQTGYTLLQTFVEHDAEVTAVRFAASGSGFHLISSGADRAIVFRSLSASAGTQFSLVAKEKMPRGIITDIAVSPDGQDVVSIGQDRWIRIWDVNTSSLRNSFQGHAAAKDLVKVSIDASGTVLALSCADGLTRLHAMADGRLLGTAGGHGQAATGLAFTEGSSKLLSVGLDGCIRGWAVPAAVVSSCCKALQAQQCSETSDSVPRVALPPLALPTSIPSPESASTCRSSSRTSRRLRRRISLWDTIEQDSVLMSGVLEEKLSGGVKTLQRSYGKENAVMGKGQKPQSPAKRLLGSSADRNPELPAAAFLRYSIFTEGSQDQTPKAAKERYRLTQDLAAMQQQLSDLGKDWSALKKSQPSRSKFIKAVKPSSGSKAKISMEAASKPLAPIPLPPLLAADEPAMAPRSAATSRKRDWSSSEESDNLQAHFSVAGNAEAFSPTFSEDTGKIATRLSFSAAVSQGAPASQQQPLPDPQAAAQTPTPTAPSPFVWSTVSTPSSLASIDAAHGIGAHEVSYNAHASHGQVSAGSFSLWGGQQARDLSQTPSFGNTPAIREGLVENLMDGSSVEARLGADGSVMPDSSSVRHMQQLSFCDSSGNSREMPVISELDLTQPSSCNSNAPSLAFGSRLESDVTPTFGPVAAPAWSQAAVCGFQPASVQSCARPAVVQTKAANPEGSNALEEQFDAVHASEKESVGAREPTPIPKSGLSLTSPRSGLGRRPSLSPTGLTPLLEEASSCAEGSDCVSSPLATASPPPRHAGALLFRNAFDTSSSSGDIEDACEHFGASVPMLMQNPFFDKSVTSKNKVPELQLGNLQLDSNPAFESERGTGTTTRTHRALARLRSLKALDSPRQDAGHSMCLTALGQANVLQGGKAPQSTESPALPQLQHTMSPELRTSRHGPSAGDAAQLVPEGSAGQEDVEGEDGLYWGGVIGGSLSPEKLQLDFGELVDGSPEAARQLVLLEADRKLRLPEVAKEPSQTSSKEEQRCPDAEPAQEAGEQLAYEKHALSARLLDEDDDVLLGSSVEGLMSYSGQAERNSLTDEAPSRLSQPGNERSQMPAFTKPSRFSPLGAAGRYASYQQAESDASEADGADLTSPLIVADAHGYPSSHALNRDLTASSDELGSSGFSSLGKQSKDGDLAAAEQMASLSLVEKEAEVHQQGLETFFPARRDSAIGPTDALSCQKQSLDTESRKGFTASQYASQVTEDLQVSKVQGRQASSRTPSVSSPLVQRIQDASGGVTEKAEVQPINLLSMKPAQRTGQLSEAGGTEKAEVEDAASKATPSVQHMKEVARGEEPDKKVETAKPVYCSESGSRMGEATDKAESQVAETLATTPTWSLGQGLQARGTTEAGQALSADSHESAVDEQTAKKSPAARLWSSMKFWKKPPLSERQGGYNSSLIALAKQGKRSKLQKAVTTQTEAAHLQASSLAANASFPLHTTGQKTLCTVPASFSVPSLAPTVADEPSRQRAAAVAQRSMLKEQVGISRPYGTAHTETVSMSQPSQEDSASNVIPRKLFHVQNNEGGPQASAPILTEQSLSQPEGSIVRARLPPSGFPVVPCASSSGSSPGSLRVSIPGGGNDSVGSEKMEEATDVGWDGLFGAGMLRVVSPGSRTDHGSSDSNTASKTPSASPESDAGAKEPQGQVVSTSKNAGSAFSVTGSDSLHSVSQAGSFSKEGSTSGGSASQGSHAVKNILGGAEKQGLELAESAAVVGVAVGSDAGCLSHGGAAGLSSVAGDMGEENDRLAEMAELPRPAAEYLSALGGLRRSAQLVSGLLKELQAASLGEGKQGGQFQESPKLARRGHGPNSARLLAESLRQSFQAEISQIAAAAASLGADDPSAASINGKGSDLRTNDNALQLLPVSGRESGLGIGGTSYEAVLQTHTALLAADVMQLLTTRLPHAEQLHEQQGQQGGEPAGDSARESETAGDKGNSS